MPDQETTDRIKQDIADQIQDGVASVSSDGVSTSFTDAAARIDALDKLNKDKAKQGAANQPHFGLRFSKQVPPGAG